MRDFGDWFRDTTQELAKREEEKEFMEDVGSEIFYGWCPALGESLYYSLTENDFVYPCKVCELDSPIYCDPKEFDPDMHYCGRSPYCCP